MRGHFEIQDGRHWSKYIFLFFFQLSSSIPFGWYQICIGIMSFKHFKFQHSCFPFKNPIAKLQMRFSQKLKFHRSSKFVIKISRSVFVVHISVIYQNDQWKKSQGKTESFFKDMAWFWSTAALFSVKSWKKRAKNEFFTKLYFSKKWNQ